MFDPHTYILTSWQSDMCCFMWTDGKVCHSLTSMHEKLKLQTLFQSPSGFLSLFKPLSVFRLFLFSFSHQLQDSLFHLLSLKLSDFYPSPLHHGYVLILFLVLDFVLKKKMFLCFLMIKVWCLVAWNGRCQMQAESPYYTPTPLHTPLIIKLNQMN